MPVVQIAVTKGKTTVDIDTDKLPDEVYQEALMLGLKVLVNRGTSKVTKTEYPDEAQLKAKAIKVANAQVELINTGKIKFSGKASKGDKITGQVKTEAMRIARGIVKDQLKAQKIKISHVAAKDITAAAKELVESTPEIIEQAKAELAKRAQTPVADKVASAISAIKVDPKKVKAAEEAAAAKKKDAPLSAKQAGKVQPRAKGKGQPQATA